MEVKSGVLYIGKNAGAYILRDLQAATRSIKIISPYLSLEKVKVLMEKAAKGINVTLIASSDIGQGKKGADNIFRELIQQHCHTDQQKKKRREIGFYFMIASYVILSLCLFGFMYLQQWKLIKYLIPFIPVIISAHILLKNMRLYTYTYSPRSDIRLSFPISYQSAEKDRQKDYPAHECFLTHVKLYVIDDEIAYLGSINFTSPGFRYNYESRIKITDRAVICKLIEEINYLHSNEEIHRMSLDKIGKSLWLEPIN